jgi:hypothetical protein
VFGISDKIVGSLEAAGEADEEVGNPGFLALSQWLRGMDRNDLRSRQHGDRLRRNRGVARRIIRVFWNDPLSDVTA